MESIKEVIINGVAYVPKEEVQPEFKVGDWVFCDFMGAEAPIRRICSMSDDTGIDDDGHGIDLEWRCNRIATSKEIEVYLIAEAERRGYKEGLKVKSTITAREGVLITNRLYYFIIGDTLTCGGIAIYDEGKWAEIVKEKKELPKTREALLELLSDYGKYVEAHYELPFKDTVEEWLTNKGY